MPEWLLVIVGIVAALVIVGGIIALSLRADRPGKKSWMARPSGEADRGPSVGGGPGD